MFMYRKKCNKVLLKSGVNFRTYSELKVSFEESEEVAAVIPEPQSESIISINIKPLEDNAEDPPKNNQHQAHFWNSNLLGFGGGMSLNSVDDSMDSNTTVNDLNLIKDYVTKADSNTSYQSDFYYDDSKMPMKIMSFPGDILNLVENQFSQVIHVNVERHDLDYKGYNGEYDSDPIYISLKKTVDDILSEIIEKGKEPLFFICDEIDLTSKAVRTRENNMANWICRLLQIESGADLVLMNGGSLRSMQTYPKDHIFTLMDLNKMTAIPDHYEFAGILGNQLVKIMENGYQGLPNALGCFLHIAGANVEIDTTIKYSMEEVMARDEELFETRIKKLNLDHMEFKSNGYYFVICHEFMLTGKDGFEAFKTVDHLGIVGQKYQDAPMLMNVAKMARDPEVRAEYALYDKYLNQFVKDSNMRVVQIGNTPFKFNKTKKRFLACKKKEARDVNKTKWLTEAVLGEFGLTGEFDMKRFTEMLETLNIECIKRLRKYNIMQGIRELEEGQFVFEILPKLYDKITQKM